MKKIIILLLCFCFTSYAQTFPVAGKTFKIVYHPSERNIFSNGSKLTLVYIFDFWGTKVSYSGGSEGLFQNVIYPDEGRKNEVEMKENGDLFVADIAIPDSAQLLSYYITDGTNFDYNDNKTYTSYIFDETGKPVKGARFRNVDFLIMAGKEPGEYINELVHEVEDYLDYHLARAVLWDKKFERTDTIEKIQVLKEEFEKEFSGLREIYNDDYDLLNAEGRVYYSYQKALSNFFAKFYDYINNKIIEIAKKIPDGKRNSIIEGYYKYHLENEKSKEFTSEIIGKPLIDFNFTSVGGDNKKLSDFKGKAVLLDFWGTWCGPCVGEIPNLVKVYQKYKENGFEIISISSDLMMNSKTEEEFKKFIEEKNMAWIHVLDDKKRAIHDLYHITHWPTLFLIDKNGIVVKNETVLRGELLEQSLEEVLNAN